MSLKLVNTFGALGYISVFVQWLWMIVTLIGPLLSYELIQKLLFPRESSSGGSFFESFVIPEPIAVIFIGLAIVFSISLSIYALIAVPRSVAQTGRKVTAKTAVATLPHLTRHKPVSKLRKKTLLERISWSIKALLISIPSVALLVPVSPKLGLEQDVVVALGIICAIASMGWFLLQFVVARIYKLPSHKLW